MLVDRLHETVEAAGARVRTGFVREVRAVAEDALRAVPDDHEHVSSHMRARNVYFDQELVRTLADGDPSLLGS
jgi:hypothetical protein